MVFPPDFRWEDVVRIDKSLGKRVSFLGATFTGDAYFGRARFSEGAYFRDAVFSMDADFWGATFSGSTYFWKVTFSGGADFTHATFGGDTNFWGVTFQSWMSFRGATFPQDGGPGVVSIMVTLEKPERVDFQNVNLFSRLLFGYEPPSGPLR